MRFGLNQSEFEFLQENLIQPLKSKNARVCIFGSRAIGAHQKFSDIDVLFIEDDKNPIPSSFVSSLIVFFEDSTFPYKLDLVNNKFLAAGYRANVEATMIEV
ncbi:MAG: hypothetical protein COT74_01100 [Bdellovibrionales bacterium CG10_big_fil_rev_8_21_14_0_10_45_34]|nr:MAG: hypothetical protein COT74_01100 [Bdellovibrionales bacterium CG10_big_fil_rev_8_21_14_0_10_45_34]